MKTYNKFYINGQWLSPVNEQFREVVNPATNQICARTVMASKKEVNLAVAAAKAAFPQWSQTSAQYRSDLINSIADEMQQRSEELSEVITMTMGCPLNLSLEIQVQGAIDAFRSYAQHAFLMEEIDEKNGIIISKEAAGVCALISPWNYPLSQLVGKIAPALAAGCTMVVKPAEQTPLQDFIMAEIFAKVGLPAGVFNLIPGVGTEIGPIMCSHADVDMISFTGSTRAGIKVSESASPSVKRVCLELGGKSPLIITEDADFSAAVRYGVEDVMINTGQTCNALTRMLVPQSRYKEAVLIAKAVAEENVVGDPLDNNVSMGPMSSMGQRDTVLNYIQQGINEGARLVTGGIELPETITTGAYVRPTIFADVDNNMSIAREEIFGPVLCLIPYQDINQAIDIANDTVFGLSSAVYAADTASALNIARRIRSGQCYIQGAYFNTNAPFGGYKQSGNGREWGEEGLMEYVEIKTVIAP
ncbi:aldehyde dehydrogenase family protein [uncultured Psychromonas sp.]|uniref:aldehyde dehydrogenase family protein n=1 Tax=uncultured Psychromonas sp. TaxID=173974 RepID=UPI00260EA3AB|nr:aldehyde dehydrogenase family protein [uncultured Psychromonas sp.]